MSARHVVVIGAGAAGLTAAIRAGEAGARVTLLNAHPRVGLKILMSGGTRCNVTHREVTERDYHGGSRHVIARILRAFTPEQTRAWFAAMGVELKLEETGKYFPVTDDAETVLSALLAECTRAGVTLRAGTQAVRLERSGGAHIDVGGGRSTTERSAVAPATGAGGTRYRVGLRAVSDSAAFGEGVRAHGGDSWPLPDARVDEWLDADAVVTATGGLSFPRTGSDGTGYALLRALGHTIVPPVPALTPLIADDPLCAGAQGVTMPAELNLWVHGKRVAHATGSLLFAHFGVTGPAALDLSRHWQRADSDSRRVTLSFAPGLERADLEDDWQRYAAEYPRRGVRQWLGQALPERIADMLTAESGLGGAAMSQIPKERRAELMRALLERDLRVTGTLGYEKAEVTAGGVPLTEVNPSTLESRLAPGLYLCGEVLDVEGRLGGFNFQWAWSSGCVAGRGVGRQ